MIQIVFYHCRDKVHWGTYCSSDFTSPGSGRTATYNYWSNLGYVHQVPLTAKWTEAVWNTKFAQHFYTNSALIIELQTLSSWAQRPIQLASRSHNNGPAGHCNYSKKKIW